MVFRWLIVGIFALALPLKASALSLEPGDSTAPAEIDVAATIDVLLTITGIDPAQPVGGAEVVIPTNIAGYQVVGGSILNPTEGALGDGIWQLIWTPIANFRPSENDFRMSIFAAASTTDGGSDGAFDFGIVTLSGVTDGTDIVLKPQSTIAFINLAGQADGKSTGGQVIATVVPEPGTLVLLGAGLAGLSLLRRRPRKENV